MEGAVAVNPLTVHTYVSPTASGVTLCPIGQPNQEVAMRFEREQDKVFRDSLDEFGPYQSWLKAYAVALGSPRGLRLQGVSIRAIHFGDDGQRIISVDVDAEVKDAEGRTLPRTVHLRGARPAVVVMLRNRGTNKDSCLFIKIARPNIADPDYIEIPECDLDGSGRFTGPVAEMIEEALDVVLHRDATVCLTGVAFGGKSEGVSTNAGLSDERVHIYLYRKNIETDEMCSLEKKLAESENKIKNVEKQNGINETNSITSLASENKKYGQLKIVSLGEAWRSTTDAKSMVALFLVHELRYHSRMPRFRAPRAALNGLRDDKRVAAKYTQVADLEPVSTGVNVVVKVVEKMEISEELGRRTDKKYKVGRMKVADKSAMISLKVTSEHISSCESLNTNDCLVVRNSRVDMVDGHMRLLVDRWGKVSAPGEDMDVNFEVSRGVDMSLIEYELVLSDDKREDARSPRGTSGGGAPARPPQRPRRGPRNRRAAKPMTTNGINNSMQNGNNKVSEVVNNTANSRTADVAA